MVQRTGLALILLLAVFASMLSAQESGFVPPKLVSDAVLELPANWSQVYSPPEVMILVEIKADSTATLVKILDGKSELESPINELLPVLVFTPAYVNDEPSTANLTIKLQISQRTKAGTQEQAATADSLKIVDKEQLTRWLERERQAGDLQQIFSSDADRNNRFSPQAFDTFYRTNFYLMGLNSRPYIISMDGWLQPSRLYYNALSFQMLSNFRRVTVDGNNVSFANKRYTLPAMCTDITAGLGDYEYNFARVQVLKNHLFGVKDFYTEFGFLVQNGWWQETISDQTSSRIFLSLPAGSTSLSFNFEKYDQDIPSTVLLPGLQSSNLFSIGQMLRDIYFKWQFPWFTLGWQNEEETLKSTGNITKQDFKTERMLLSTALSTSLTDLSADYQYNYKHDLPAVQPLYQYSKQPIHQLNATLQKQWKSFDYKLQALNSEDGVDYGKADLGFSSILGRLGLSAEQNRGQSDTSVFNAFYPDSNDTVFTPATFTYQRISAEYSAGIGIINWDVLTGKKVVRSFTSRYLIPPGQQKDAVFAVSDNYERVPWFCDMKLQCGKRVFGIDLILDQVLQWTQYKEGLFELPELQGQTRFKLVREMNYGNAISAGINLTGHTDYIKADNAKTPVYGALVADAWAGVKITDLFEFQVTMKNLGNNIIYGLYPHPRTILATIHWFYLN
jgi:hypothetical protein